MINYGGYYTSKKGEKYKVLNPVFCLADNKLEQGVLFMAMGTGQLFTMHDNEFLKRFTEVEKEND